MKDPRVLVVDDDRLFRLYVVMLLQHGGMTVVEAKDGGEALTCLEAQPIDLVVTDVRMPGMDGFQLLARARELFPDLPVLLVSGHVDADIRAEAVRRGALRILSKPIEPAALLGCIQDAMAGRPGSAALDGPGSGASRTPFGAAQE